MIENRIFEVVVIIALGTMLAITVFNGDMWKGNIENITITKAPSVNIENPANGDILSNNTNPIVEIVTYYSAGVIGAIKNVSIYVDGLLIYYENPNKNSGYVNYTWDYGTYSEGQHVIRVDATDLLDQTASDRINVYVNLKKPYGTIINPLNNSILTGNNVSFTVSAIDDGSGIYSIKYFLDYTLLHTSYFAWPAGYKENITNTCYINTTLYSDGKHYIYAIINDNFNNINLSKPGWSYTTPRYTITIDNNPPIVKIINPLNNSDIKGIVNISVNATDYGSGIAYVEFYIDSVLVWKDTTYPYVYSWNTNSYVSGTHIIKVIAYDNAGFSRTESIYVIVDNEKPSITITAPTNSTLTNKSEINVIWVGDDAISGINHYEIKIDDESWKNVFTSTNYTFLGISDGNHTIYVKAIDNAGNYAISSVCITVDTSKPSITITAPRENTTINSTTVVINFVTRDNLSGIKKCEIKVDNGIWIDLGKNTTWIIENLSNGKHTVYVMVTDNAGNTAVKKVEFTVEISSAKPRNPTSLKTLPWWIFAAGIGIVVLIVGVLLIIRKIKKSK